MDSSRVVSKQLGLAPATPLTHPDESQQSNIKVRVRRAPYQTSSLKNAPMASQIPQQGAAALSTGLRKGSELNLERSQIGVMSNRTQSPVQAQASSNHQYGVTPASLRAVGIHTISNAQFEVQEAEQNLRVYKEIAQDVSQVAQINRDMAQFVDEQQRPIDQAQVHIDKTKKHTQSGASELLKAAEYQAASQPNRQAPPKKESWFKRLFCCCFPVLSSKADADMETPLIQAPKIKSSWWKFWE